MQINKRKISKDTQTYFIADLASNHDGDIERAKILFGLLKKQELIVQNSSIF